MEGRNIVIEDGIPWRKVAGKLWTSYDNAAEYSGYTKASLYNKASAGYLHPRQFGSEKNLAKDELDLMLIGPESR